ncbi:MAG: M48 family metallopeptidase [Planctomycetota bacterium]|nr:M48 family metallopeptidase [Planctomycetota bacterium]
MAQFESLIAANKRKSLALVALFVLFYTALLFSLFFTVVVTLWGWTAAHETRAVLAMLLGSHAMAVVLAVVCYVGGPGMVLSASRAEPIHPAKDQVLHDVVEEMAVAAGCPVPPVYVIDSPAMNAMAAGLMPERSVIVVTRGLCERLDRDQLQAVIAHELARIQTYDVRLMTVMATMVGMMILVSALMKQMVSAALETGPSSAWYLVWFLFILPPVGLAVVLAPPCVRLIQLAVSRERQSMADTEAVRLTRYPEALARALEILATDTEYLAGANGATAHLFIVRPTLAEGRRAGGDGVWSAHPEIEERIERLRSIGNIGQ